MIPNGQKQHLVVKASAEDDVDIQYVGMSITGLRASDLRAAGGVVAQETQSKIRAGKDFNEIAGDYSEDKVSAKKGGDLGWLKEGSIDPRFSKALFDLKPGEVTEPVETQFGFHVIILIEGPRNVKRPFNAVAGDIRYQLRNKAKKAEMERLLTKAKIEKE